MATVRGRSAVKQFMADNRAALEKSVLRGAATAAATVVAEEAKERSISHEVSEGVVVSRPKAEGGQIVVKITIKPGWAHSLAVWEEYGTNPHFISVDDSQREGKTVKRINKLAKEGSLVIGGKFIGKTVHHPGARAHPFLRPALDTKEGEAVAAAQRYIDAHVKRSGVVATSNPDDDA